MTDAQDLENELAPEDSGAVSSDDSSMGGAALAADLDKLATEIAKLRDTLARSQADYKNLVARTERERQEMADFVTEKLAVKLLPSLDNFERLLSGTPEAERKGALYEGVKSTLSGLSKAFATMGIEPFESAGQPLDPVFHEAIVRAPGAEGVVVAELEKGYKLREKVIRHAKVAVGD
jgi:molecular chaperone GrpE